MTARRATGQPRWRFTSYARRTLYYVTALLSAVVIISALASYLVMRNQISKMAAERSLVELHRTAASFSSMFASSIIPAAEQVFETAEVSQLIYGSTISEQQLLTATRLLDRFQLANPLIDSIAVYNSQRGTVYSTRYGLLPASDPHNDLLMHIFRQINAFRLYRFIPLRDDGTELLTIILGTRPYSGGRLLGGLVVNLSERAVRRQLVGPTRNSGSQLTILDNSGTILSGNDPKRFGMDAASSPVLRAVMDHPANSGSFSMAVGHSASLVSFVRSPLVGWTFVSATPNRVLFAGIARWSNEIIIVFSILLVLSIALAFTASRRVSGPVEQLLGKARSLQSGISALRASDSRRDDVLLISETLDLLNHRLHDLSAARLTPENALARAFTRQLRDQTIAESERQELNRRLFDESTGEVWILAIVVDGIDSHQGATDRTRMLAACRELTRQLRECRQILASGESERGTVAAALPVDRAESSFSLPRAVRTTIDAALPAGGSFTVGVSYPTGDPDELAAAYESALEAVRYRFRSGGGAVIRQEERQALEEPFLLPEGELRRLSEQARLLNDAAVEETIRSMVQGVLPYSYEDFVFLSQNILHVLERVFAESRVMPGRELAAYRAIVLNGRWIETAEEVNRLTTEWYRRFAQAARQMSGQRLTTFVADVKAVVTQSLEDPDLSAKSVAARLKVSVNYVRTTFKAATGEPLSGHITRLRIERCKELLADSELPVKEIAESVGFRNSTYFFTLFKKQTGQTPQEYQRRISTK